MADNSSQHLLQLFSGVPEWDKEAFAAFGELTTVVGPVDVLRPLQVLRDADPSGVIPGGLVGHQVADRLPEFDVNPAVPQLQQRCLREGLHPVALDLLGDAGREHQVPGVHGMVAEGFRVPAEGVNGPGD